MKSSAPSLSWRLISRVVLAGSAAVLVAYAWLYWKNFKVAEVLRDRTLIAQAQDIAQHLWLGPDGGVRLQLPAQLEEAYDDKKGVYHYAVRDGSGELLMSSGANVGPIPNLGRLNPRTYDYKPNINATRQVFGVADEIRLGDRSLVIQVERRRTGGDSLGAKVVNEFFTDGGWLGAPFLLALLGICAVTVRRTLAPVRRLSVLATQIGPARADLRFPETGVPSEVLPLVQAVNSGLDRLAAGFHQQREFTANAAHQLRTPLAVLAANIDLIADEAIAASLRRDLEVMSRLATQLLLVARLETSALDLDQSVDLEAVARETVISLGPLAVAAGKTIAVDAADGKAAARGNLSLIRSALDNLVENAIAHTPKGTSVLIRVRRLRIDVIDTGPGIPAELREKIFERFWRGDYSQSGAGLGLSIVQRAMDAHGGTVSVSEPPGGGAIFTLEFTHRAEEAMKPPRGTTTSCNQGHEIGAAVSVSRAASIPSAAG